MKNILARGGIEFLAVFLGIALSLWVDEYQKTKIKISHFYDDVEFQDYDRYYQLNPDGDLLKYRIGKTNIIQFNQILNQTSYFSIGVSNYEKKYSHMTFENLSDYIHEDLNFQGWTSRAQRIHPGFFQLPRGDFDADYSLNILDIFIFDNYLNGNSEINTHSGDLNEDGVFNIQDLEILICLLTGSEC